MTMMSMSLNSNLTMIAVLLVLAAIFYLVEICTPTFGIMAIAALASEAGAIYFAYSIGSTFGTITLISTIVGTVAYLVLAVKYLPKTPLGKLLVLSKSRNATSEGTPEADKLAQLVGQTGTELSDLRPVGKADIDGHVYDARAERTMVEKGTTIEVIAAGGTDIVVRPADRSDNDSQKAGNQATIHQEE